jgi:TM2 domain-containing membrane protein YozV
MLKSKDPYKDPLVAGMLALIPGAGHLYCGEPLRGVTYLAGTVAGLFLFVVPGVFIWAASIPDVILCVRRRNRLASPWLHASALKITDGPDPDCPPMPHPATPSHPEASPEPDPLPGSPR